MDSERFAALSATFGLCLERPPADREGYLEQALAHDPELLAEARAMLAAHHRGGDFLRPPTDETLTSATAPEAVTLVAGTTVGEFTLVEPLGSGGMGEVWRARQERPRRDVALKALRAGFRSDRERRRFEDEAETLARLQHPGIAKVLAAGVLPGVGRLEPRPWFAMELIDGAQPLDAFAADRPVEARLQLLRTVCEAVHHGHLRGVVHRDLKPDNVVVGADGRPRVIDFGIARAGSSTAHDLSLTGDGALLGTLAYMAPEQVRGEGDRVDGRTDVHALGVLLHELLTGESPWRARREGRGWTELAREVRDDDPELPSRRDPGLSRELDWIVARATAKEPERRYASAQELGEDLRRFLAREPLVAGPPRVTYRAGKFVRRNLAWVAGGVTAVLLLVLGIAGTAYGLLESLERGRELERRGEDLAAARDEAERARGEAVERLDRALAINQFLDTMLRGANPFSAPGVGLTTESTVGQMLDRAAERVDEAFPDRPDLEGQSRLLIGVSYEGQGQYAKAEVHLAEALRLLEASKGTSEADRFKARRLLAVVRVQLGVDDERQLERLLETREAAYASLEPDFPELAALDADVAWLLQRLGRVAESVPYAEAAVARFEALGPEFAPAAASAASHLAVAERLSGDPARIEAAYRRSLELIEQGYGAQSLAAANAHSNLGLCLLDLGRPAEARASLERAIALVRTAVAGDHPLLAVAQYNLAYALSLLGEAEACHAISLDCLELNRRLYGSPHPETADALIGLALSLYDLERFDEAAERFDEAAAAREVLLGSDHRKTREARARRSDAVLRSGDPGRREEALAALEGLYREVQAELGDGAAFTGWLVRTGVRATARLEAALGAPWRARLER